MKYLLDPDTCIAVLRGVHVAVEYVRRLSPDDCAVSSVTAFELYADVEKAREPTKERQKVDRFLTVISVLPFDMAAAREAGRIRGQLQDAGTPIGPYDLLIAAHALATGALLVTGNEREFSRVRGLRIESWDTTHSSLETTHRGAAAAEGSRRDKCVRSKLGAVSRRPERGDFVAQGGERCKSRISSRTIRRQRSQRIC